MYQPNLRIGIGGLEEAEVGDPCYEVDQPWFLYIKVTNSNPHPSYPNNTDIGYKENPTGGCGAFSVRFDVFNGKTIDTGILSSTLMLVKEGLGGYPSSEQDTRGFFMGFSMRLPKNMSKADFGVTHGFQITIDTLQEVAESKETDNVYIWNFSKPLSLHIDSPINPYTDLKFIQFKPVSGSNKDLDVLVQNHGPEKSFNLAIRLQILGDPTPRSPTGSVLETINAPSTALEPGESTWVRLTTTTPFVISRNDYMKKGRRPKLADGYQTISQMRRVLSDAKNGTLVNKYTIVEKNSNFMPLKPFVITLMSSDQQEKIGFGQPARKSSGGGTIHIPIK